MSTIRQAGPSAEERAALERDVESYRAYLLHVAARLRQPRAGAAEAASDLVQQAILAAVQRARSGTIPGPDPAERKAWLRRILINTWSRSVRHQAAAKRGGGRVVVGLDDPGPDPGSTPSHVVARREQEHRMAAAIAGLEPGDRQLLAWRFGEGLTWDEIGRRRGCSGSYAHRLVGSTLARLQRSLKA